MRVTTKKLIVGLWLALLLQWNTGCSVLDEINNANEAMGIKGSKKAENAEKAKAEINEAEQAKRQAVKDYWKSLQSLAPEELDESIVRCENNGSVSFMGNDECLSIGGTVQ